MTINPTSKLSNNNTAGRSVNSNNTTNNRNNNQNRNVRQNNHNNQSSNKNRNRNNKNTKNRNDNTVEEDYNQEEYETDLTQDDFVFLTKLSKRVNAITVKAFSFEYGLFILQSKLWGKQLKIYNIYEDRIYDKFYPDNKDGMTEINNFINSNYKKQLKLRNKFELVVSEKDQYLYVIPDGVEEENGFYVCYQGILLFGIAVDKTNEFVLSNITARLDVKQIELAGETYELVGSNLFIPAEEVRRKGGNE